MPERPASKPKSKPFDLVEFVRASTKASGVPEKVTDQRTLQDIADMIAPTIKKPVKKGRRPTRPRPADLPQTG